MVIRPTEQEGPRETTELKITFSFFELYNCNSVVAYNELFVLQIQIKDHKILNRSIYFI